MFFKEIPFHVSIMVTRGMKYLFANVEYGIRYKYFLGFVVVDNFGNLLQQQERG
jgi:hypothetical protein